VTLQAPTDQVGTELLFENDTVRVWSMELAPSETSPLHRHEVDYIIAYVTPSRISLMRDGAVVQTDDFKDGYVQYIHVPQPIVHQITNSARARHRQLIVELKVREGLSPTSDNGRKVSAQRAGRYGQ
jgi:quercetin dioxygenase-like cupin family protein